MESLKNARCVLEKSLNFLFKKGYEPCGLTTFTTGLESGGCDTTEKVYVPDLHTRIDWPPPLPGKFTRFPAGKTGLEMATRRVIASPHEVKYRGFV